MIISCYFLPSYDHYSYDSYDYLYFFLFLAFLGGTYFLLQLISYSSRHNAHKSFRLNRHTIN